MIEANNETPSTPKSFKAALRKVYGDDDLDECWGDLLSEEIVNEKMDLQNEEPTGTSLHSASPCPAVDLTK